MADETPQPSMLAFVLFGPVTTVLVFLIVSYTIFGQGAVPFGLATGIALAAGEYLLVSRVTENRPD